MIQAYLDNIKEDAYRVLIEYTNKRVESSLTGDKLYNSLFNDSKRLHYLVSIIDYLYLINETPYLGGGAVSESYVKSVVDKVQHYSGIYSGVDLEESVYETVTEDDGDGSSCSGSVVITTDDHYRSGSVAVTAGTNIVTFVKDGVVSPLPSSDYTAVVWVTLTDGSIQRNLVPTTKTAGGFVVSDVLASGTLEYQATLNT